MEMADLSKTSATEGNDAGCNNLEKYNLSQEI